MVNIRIMIFLVWCGNPISGQSDTKYTLKIGVATAEHTDWMQIVNSAQEVLLKTTNRQPVYIMAIEYIDKKYDINTTGIGLVREKLINADVALVMGAYNMVVALATQELHIPYVILETVMVCKALAFDNLYILAANQNVLDSVAVDIAKQYEWGKVAIVYDDDDGLQTVQEFMMDLPRVNLCGVKLSQNTRDDDIRQRLLEIRENSFTNFVLQGSDAIIEKVFKTAMSVSMLSKAYSWIVLSVDVDEVNFTPYNYTQVNLTTLKLNQVNNTIPTGKYFPQRLITADALLLLDTVMTKVMKSAIRNCPPTCDYTVTPGDVQQYMDKVQFQGLSGWVNFDEKRRRRNISLSLLSFGDNGTARDNGMEKIGDWNNSKTSRVLEMYPRKGFSPSEEISFTFTKNLYKIVIIEDPPFIMCPKAVNGTINPQQCKGFLIELIGKIAENAGFKYELYYVPDGNYGKKVSGNVWNGMIRELIDNKADMCLGAISITSQREKAVDFTKPFMQKTYNLLIKKPQEKATMFQFLWPLSYKVWLLTISALIFLGFLLYFMDKFIPNFPDEPGRFNLSESMWFIYGSLVGASTEVGPRTLSARLLSGAWWFFSLILVSSYTANLAAVLTVTKFDTPIRSLTDLVRQTKIQYGTVQNSNCHLFFQNSTIDLYRKMWEFIDATDGLVNNSSDGLARVQAGDYAFIWDKPVNDYLATKHCDIMTVGTPFDEKGYGIGVPLGSPYRDALSMAILEINEEGVLQKLIDKWWSGGECGSYSDTSTGSRKELDLYNVAGVFLILAFGSTLALLTCSFEYFIRKCRAKHLKKKSVVHRLVENHMMKADPGDDLLKDKATKV